MKRKSKKEEKDVLEEFVNELTKIKAADVYKLYKLGKEYEGTIIGETINFGIYMSSKIVEKWGEQKNE